MTAERRSLLVVAVAGLAASGLAASGLAASGLACVSEPVDAEHEPDVSIEINPDVDLSSYASFAVVDPLEAIATEPPAEYTAIAAELEQAIIAELGDKGLVHDPEQPDLLINPLISVARANDAVSFYSVYWGWYYDYHYQWTLIWDYPLGSLMLDVVDPHDPDDAVDDVLVYRGVARGLLAGDASVLGLELRNAVQALFADWGVSGAPEGP